MRTSFDCTNGHELGMPRNMRPMTNTRLDPGVETVFLMADGEFSHVSSSLIRQIATFGGGESLGLFVPEICVRPILEKSAQS